MPDKTKTLGESLHGSRGRPSTVLGALSLSKGSPSSKAPGSNGESLHGSRGRSPSSKARVSSMEGETLASRDSARRSTDKPTTETPPTELKFVANPGLPNAFADKLQLVMRSDGLALLRWIQDLPEGSVEVSRVVVTQEHLKRIVDLCCRQTGYYPAAGAKGK